MRILGKNNISPFVEGETIQGKNNISPFVEGKT
jgi:hypothetical protein